MPGRSFMFLCAVVLTAACDGPSMTSPLGAIATERGVTTGVVTIVSLQFTPATIIVSPGTIVTWTNRDKIAHNVTFSSSAITSIAEFSSGVRTSAMPQAAGNYSYRCTLHPGMAGSVVVQ